MSLEYSDMTHQEIRYVNPCFCCEMKTHRFYLLANSTLFILSFGMIVFALLMLFEFNIIFSSLGLLLIASFHLIISLVSFLKFHRYKTIGTRFHKWQAIGNIIFSMIIFLLYSMGVIYLLVLTLGADLKNSEVWNGLAFKCIILVCAFPVLVFYTYWSLLFMRVVSERRETYLTRAKSTNPSKSVSQFEQSEADRSRSNKSF